MDTIIVRPAYGAVYLSQGEAKTAWSKGVDFQINDRTHPYNGAYLSKRDWRHVSTKTQIMCRVPEGWVCVVGTLDPMEGEGE